MKALRFLTLLLIYFSTWTVFATGSEEPFANGSQEPFGGSVGPWFGEEDVRIAQLDPVDYLETATSIVALSRLMESGSLSSTDGWNLAYTNLETNQERILNQMRANPESVRPTTELLRDLLRFHLERSRSWTHNSRFFFMFELGRILSTDADLQNDTSIQELVRYFNGRLNDSPNLRTPLQVYENNVNMPRLRNDRSMGFADISVEFEIQPLPDLTRYEIRDITQAYTSSANLEISEDASSPASSTASCCAVLIYLCSCGFFGKGSR